jgi:hypothetical protein
LTVMTPLVDVTYTPDLTVCQGVQEH